MAGATPQFQDLRHFGPAAARDDAVVTFDRATRGFRRPRRQHGNGRFRHVNGARGLIEPLAEFAVIDVTEQRVERSIVRPCGVNPSGKCRYAEKTLQHSAAARLRLLRTRSVVGSSHWTRVCASIAAEISQHPKSALT
jgi:hypothetical protein